MEFFQTKSEITKFFSPLKEAKKNIGFVPTMGALHSGHLSLVEKSANENDYTIVSIFVNPTQFNNLDDLQKYPRTLEADLQKIESLRLNVAVFAPSVEEMYKKHEQVQKFDFQGLDTVMEGTSRPGHFDGVATIVKKLFDIISPTKAYFGEKDYQQVLIIKQMVKQTQNNVQIIPCPIVREENGLAMSSRNQRLSPAMKQKASFIYQSLQKAKQLFINLPIAEVVKTIETLYENEPNFTLEYFTIADADTLQLATEKQTNKTYRAFIVVHAEEVRLIDNIEL